MSSIWVEKYRPNNLENYVGNDMVINTIRTFLKNEDVPNLLFWGKAGGGKTTLAKIIVKELDCDYLYINASDENNVDTVRDKIKTFAINAGFSKWKIVILDEADYLTTNSQAILRNVMESYSTHTRFILTCNYVEKLIEPIQSRCQSFNLIPPGKKQVAKRLVEIINNEHIDYKIEDIVKIVDKYYPDIRKCINVLQQFSVTGTLSLKDTELTEYSHHQMILDHLVKSDKKTAFTEIRKILNVSGQTRYEDLITYLYNNIEKYATGHIGPVILILNEGQRDDIIVPDKELNISAMFVKILQELK